MAEESLVPVHSTVAVPDRRWWGFAGVEYNRILSLVYSIGLWDLEKDQVYTPENPIDPAYGGSLAEFEAGGKEAVYYFTTPPKTYEIVENAATTIVPTQEGGKFIESHGNIFKDITISGTVGFRPNPASTELIPGLASATGVNLSVPPLFQPRDDRGLDPKEKTGFDEMIHLRNLFRLYFDLKSDPDMARKIVMIWMYLKESEVYVVEPINFTTNRDSSNPLSWNYSISLRTLYRFDTTLYYIQDPLNIFQQLGAAMDFLNSAVDSIVNALNQINAAIDFVANLPANLINSVTSAVSSILSAAASLANTVVSFPKTVSESVLKTVSNACRDIRESIDTVAAAAAATGEYFEDPDDVDPDDIGTKAFAGKSGQVRKAFNDIDRAVKGILALDVLWKIPKQRLVSDYSGAFVDESGNPPFNAGSPLNPSNIVIPNSAKEVRIQGGDDIRAIAKKFLGREDKWKLLAIINNLKPPYISAEPADGVLTPGDNILIPVEDSQTTSGTIPRVTNSDALSEGEGVALKSYGRDIKLKDTATGVDLGDLQVNNSGDLDVVSGVSNVEQGLKIVFATEKGGLALHPEFGTRYAIGTKIHLPRIQEFAINTRQALLSDQRIASITSMKVYAVGDQVISESKVKLKSADYQLPVTFAVRR